MSRRTRSRCIGGRAAAVGLEPGAVDPGRQLGAGSGSDEVLAEGHGGGAVRAYPDPDVLQVVRLAGIGAEGGGDEGAHRGRVGGHEHEQVVGAVGPGAPATPRQIRCAATCGGSKYSVGLCSQYSIGSGGRGGGVVVVVEPVVLAHPVRRVAVPGQPGGDRVGGVHALPVQREAQVVEPRLGVQRADLGAVDPFPAEGLDQRGAQGDRGGHGPGGARVRHPYGGPRLELRGERRARSRACCSPRAVSPRSPS